MPLRQRSPKQTDEIAPVIAPAEGRRETPKEPAKTPEQEFEERPDIQFARDFDPDLTFAYQWESAIEMESEYEDDLERELRDDANSEPWAARLMRQSWGADPAPTSLDDFARFRMPADAYKAMKITDPMEAMLVAQASALHTNMIYVLSQATRLASLKTNPDLCARYYASATKLGVAYGKHMETLQRYRTKGQQKVAVKYERQAGDRRTKGRISRSEKHRITVSKTGGLDVNLGNRAPDQEGRHASIAASSAKIA